MRVELKGQEVAIGRRDHHRQCHDCIVAFERVILLEQSEGKKEENKEENKDLCGRAKEEPSRTFGCSRPIAAGLRARPIRVPYLCGN